MGRENDKGPSSKPAEPGAALRFAVRYLGSSVGWMDSPGRGWPCGARCGACAATLDGSIYVIGGMRSVELTAAHSVERFRDGQWELAPPLATTRSRACAAVLDGAIYVIGGEGSGNALSSVECFRDGPSLASCAAASRAAIERVRSRSRWSDLRDWRWHHTRRGPRPH